jgi:hypothetical protein
MIPADTMSTIISLAGPIIAAAGLISAVWWRMESRVETIRTEAGGAAKVAADAARDVEKQLSDFKVKVAEEYASWDTVKAIEVRLTERMDSLTEQVMKMPEAIVDRIFKYTSLNPQK